MSISTRRRNKYFVDRKVQGSLGGRILMHWFIFLSLSLVLTTFMQLVTRVDNLSPAEALRGALLDQLGPLTAFLGLLPWFVYDALRLSNRFAGPMVRLRHAMRELQSGGTTRPVAFRDGDFWPDIAEQFNQLQEQILEDRQQLQQLRSELEESHELEPEGEAASASVLPLSRPALVN